MAPKLIGREDGEWEQAEALVVEMLSVFVRRRKSVNETLDAILSGLFAVCANYPGEDGVCGMLDSCKDALDMLYEKWLYGQGKQETSD